ncbi:MAG TPA: PP2C family serine/threonine-protein phosphatase, partial [Pyrinomonadaceae bacterium]
MVQTAAKTVASKENNEDFVFQNQSNGQYILIVGDFAQTDFSGIDTIAMSMLEKNLEKYKSEISPADLLLVQLITQFNNELLGWQKDFQCCVLFALIEGNRLFYLPVGDCRVAVKRGKNLILLNGTVWTDKSGLPLPPMVFHQQNLKRGSEEPPKAALGVQPVNFSTSHVRNFLLEADDTILIYSDGVDKFVSPEQLLKAAMESSSASEIADRILEEVKLNHGDDDRSIIIASGPHSAKESPSEKESREILFETRAEIQQKLSQLQTALNPLEKLQENLRKPDELKEKTAVELEIIKS